MKQIIIISIIFAFIVSCNREDIPDTITNSGKHGAYILNEGNFSWSNASLSFLNLLQSDETPPHAPWQIHRTYSPIKRLRIGTCTSASHMLHCR